MRTRARLALSLRPRKRQRRCKLGRASPRRLAKPTESEPNAVEFGAEAGVEAGAGVEVAVLLQRATVDPLARSAPRTQKSRMKNQTLTLTTIMEAEALIVGLVVHARDDPPRPPRLAATPSQPQTPTLRTMMQARALTTISTDSDGISPSERP